MRPMSAKELQEIALDIATEVNRLNQLESQMRLVQAAMLTNPALADICAESLALKLHNFYTGCERIFQIIASELNGGLPSSYDWQRRLLNPMSKPLLQAASQIWQKIPETKFVFVGPTVGNSEQIYAQYQDPRIIRLGSVDLQTKTDALAACTLLCVPSTQESFGGVYTEAWSFAKPVIGGDIPAVAEVISQGVDGFLVPQESQSIAETICQVLLANNLAASLGMAGQRKVREKFTWQRLAEKNEQIYRDLLAK